MIKYIHIVAILTVATVLAVCPSMSNRASAQDAERDLFEQLDSNADPLDTYAQADRLSGIRDTLRLSAEQERLWRPVEEALANIQQQRRAFRSAMMSGGPTDQIERLRRRAELATQRADALRKLADAMQPLWATLSDSQKRELTRNFAMMPRRGDQERRMGYGRDDDDGDRPRRQYRDDWRYDDRDRGDRNDGEWRYHQRDRMMGRRGSDQSDDRDDLRRDRYDRYDRSPRWRSYDDDRPRSRDFDRDRRDFDRRSDRDDCRCRRQD